MYTKNTSINSTISFNRIQSTPDRLGYSPGKTKNRPKATIFHKIIYGLTIITIYDFKTPVVLQMHELF